MEFRLFDLSHYSKRSQQSPLFRSNGLTVLHAINTLSGFVEGTTWLPSCLSKGMMIKAAVRSATTVLEMLLFASVAAAQQSATIQLNGRVSGELQMDFGQASSSDASARVVASRINSAAIRLEVTTEGSSKDIVVRIPLTLRTNVKGFAIVAQVDDSEYNGEIRLTPAQPLGGTSLLSARAIQNFRPLTGELQPAMTLAEGTRISAGGNRSSPENGLQSTLEVRLGASNSSQSRQMVLDIRMEDASLNGAATLAGLHTRAN
jgi:hypothetical protein